MLTRLLTFRLFSPSRPSSPLAAMSTLSTSSLSSTPPRRIILVGGTGFLGKYTAKAFLASDGKSEIILASRRAVVPDDISKLGNQISAMHIDVTNDRSVDDAIRGADVVVNLVGIMFGPFNEIQHLGAKRIAEFAKKHNVRKLVHISAIGANASSSVPYARSKAFGEKAVLDTLGTAAVVLRPSLVFGREDDFFNRFAKLARILPFIPVFGGGTSKFQPIYVFDVANAIVKSVNNPQVAGQIVELGGPKVYTYKELMRLMLDQAGISRLIISLPWFVGYIQAFFLSMLPQNLFTITADQITLLKNDNIVTSPLTIESLGIKPVAPENILHTYLRPQQLTQPGMRTHKMYTDGSLGEKIHDVNTIMESIPKDKRKAQ